MEYKLLKLLKDKNVADAYQYYQSCVYKLYLAECSYNALKNVIEKYQAEETAIVQKVYADAKKTGKGTYKVHSNAVDFLGVEMGATEVMDKLTMEIMGLLHNFFDTFAQWLNAALFGEEALPLKQVSLVSVTNKLPKFTEYTGQFIDDVGKILKSSTYVYISDFNNTLKHRYQIYIRNKFDIFKVQGTVDIPAFSKDGRVHVKAEALKTINNDLKYCKDLLEESRVYIENYYAISDNAHVEHRLYNPKTYMFFASEEDYQNMHMPVNHYHYIEIDSADLPDKMQIMLTYDRMNGTPDERIECFNSPYPIIMLREKEGNEILGILKPNDNETFSLNDEHELQYREYIATYSGFEQEKFDAICGNDTFHYYVYLSDMTGGYEIK